MNITLPKPQNAISTLGKVSITPFITVLIFFLDRIKALKRVRVAMPEITIPLNNQPHIRNENIYNKFSSDNLLFFKSDRQLLLQLAACIFKFCGLAVGNVCQYFPKVAMRSISTIITASMGAITNAGAINPPSWGIERFITGFTSDDFPSPPNGCSTLSCLFLSFCSVLPFVCAIQRAETYNAVFSGYKDVVTPFTCVGTASITPFRAIRGGRVWLMASLTNLLFSNICIHESTIPCQIGGVK